MALKYGPEAEAVRDLARRCVPKGEKLGIDVLLPALFQGSGLKDRFPQLAAFFPKPRKRRKEPEAVPLAEDLKPVMRDLASAGHSVLTPETWFSALLQSPVGQDFASTAGIPAEDLDTALKELTGVSLAVRAPAPTAEAGWRGSRERREVVSALDTFGRMLTVGEPPQKGIVELEKPMKALVRALVKRKQRSAIVIGQAGTGKSALVYEFARRLVVGDPSIPKRLEDCDIFELSPTFLRSGASHVGQYEERVSSVIRVLGAHPKVILFVDEVHSMLQSGIHERGPITDANEAFKQAISLGEISLIGCTTTAEYRHYIEPDQAMAQRFSTIRLEPPSPEQTTAIMKARRQNMEDFYGVEIPEDLLETTVDLTEEYLLGRAQPRKSIQLLDEACAYCVTQNPPIPRLTEEALWQALEDTVGHGVVRGDTLTETDLFERLKAKIVGQDDTLQKLSRAFVSGLGGWVAKRGAPRGVYFFCGPTGVGKTETALLLSKILGGGRESLVRIDCNTLQGSGRDSGPALHILLGVPPGYVGYVRGKGGVLSRIRDHPESIVLFDEIEKADPGVGKLLLQIIDDGRCEDHDGHLLDFRRSFIVFTTNAGAVYDDKTIGFGPDSGPPEPTADMEALKNEIRRMGLGEEFLGRITHFFEFQGLQADSVETILRAQLERLAGTADERGLGFEWEEAVVGHLVSEWQPRFGVRHLVAILRNRVVEQLSVAEAQGELKGVEKIRLEILETETLGEVGDLTGLAKRTRRNGTLVISLV
jgi:ATP-dependent Clp protease ATP-binding subunit ClpA